MPATPVYQLPYPAPADPADVPTDMQELAARIEAVLPTIGRPPTRTFITANGNYTPPAGCKAILVECWGGGGGGTGAATTAAAQNSAPGGGGGGGYAASLIANPTGPYACAIGGGGAGSTGTAAAAAGGATSFGSAAVAGGGGGGYGGFATAVPNYLGQGGPGGNPTAGDLQMQGEAGEAGQGIVANSVRTSKGGASPRGGEGGGQYVASTGTNGSPGQWPGGGGGGGGNVQSQGTARAGGAGSAGLICVTEYY